MCGISGVILPSGHSVDQAELKKMADSIAHRGPDAEGFFLKENVGLAHRRLKIIDLSAQANQPMYNASKTIAVVFNGEIYNFQELRVELKTYGHEFRTQSDTEVIVKGFEQWGADIFKRLNGMFAIAIWDDKNETLHLARDRFGIKPLFYSLQNGKLGFASELQALLTLPLIQKDLDSQVLFYYLKFSHVPHPHSIIKNVHQMTPGTRLELSRGRLRTFVFWDPFSISENKKEPIHFDEILSRVILRQTFSDVPIGFFLSGGIDSSLLVAAYADATKSDPVPIQTFTIGYHEREFDESVYALEVSRHFKTQHHELILRPQDFFELLPNISRYFDQPFGDPTLLPSLLLAKFAKSRVSVVLSGDGGDELFFGYSYQHALLHLKLLTRLPSAFRKQLFRNLAEWSSGTRSLVLQRLQKFFEICQFTDDTELLYSFIGTVGPTRIDKLAGLMRAPVTPSIPLPDHFSEAFTALNWKDKIEQIFLRTFLTDTVLNKTDRTTMAYGLEARVPFLDDELVNFSSKLDFKQKYAKNILKRKLAEKLPSRLVYRRKQGFSIPLRDWLRGDLKFLLFQYLDEHRLRKEGIFNPKPVDELVKSHLNGRANHSHLLWSLICFQMWKERHLP